MAVLIHEFEVVPAAEPKESVSAAATPKQAEGGSATAPQEIFRALQRMRDRAMRLRAH